MTTQFDHGWYSRPQADIDVCQMGARTTAKAIRRPRIADLVQDAMHLERRTMELYCRFESLFQKPDAVRSFWLGMAEHESRHVGALALVVGLLESETLREMPVVPPPARKHIAHLQRLLDRAEREASGSIALTRAFELALEIESSEIEDLVLDLLQLLRGTEKRELAVRTLIHDLSDLSFMIERYGGSRALLQKADRVIERELRRHEEAAINRSNARPGVIATKAPARRGVATRRRSAS